MGVFGDLLGGFATALSPEYLLLAALGVTLGTAVGVLPGIGPALTIALLLPVTLDFDPTGAFVMFAGIYYGGMYGGSTTSILLNTPGRVVLRRDHARGIPHGQGGTRRRGPGHRRGGLLRGRHDLHRRHNLPRAAVRAPGDAVQPADYFALMVLAFMSVTALVGRSLVRGMTSLFLGLFLGLIGIDELTGQERLTFGVQQLLDGLDVVVVAVGLFAVGEALYVAARMRHDTERSCRSGAGSG